MCSATAGPARVGRLLRDLGIQAQRSGVKLPFTANTPYINTIHPSEASPVSRQPRDRAPHQEPRPLERAWRWWCAPTATRTASAATSRPTPRPRRSTRSASTTSSAAATNGNDGDLIYFQGHASPGIYARAFLEGRLSVEQLENFRRELQPGGGLSSYPHPWLMPDFWEFPTVSMGLGPDHGHLPGALQPLPGGSRPEAEVRRRRSGPSSATARPTSPSRSAPSRWPSREKLDNLIFVVNCNLQRLDGPVRGNGKIIQELEAIFRGAGWNVIKVHLGQRVGCRCSRRTPTACSSSAWAKIVDGEYQKYAVEDGAYIRKHFCGTDPRLLDMVQAPLRRAAQEAAGCGGHDPEKVYTAYKARGRAPRAADRRSSPAPSRATASARPARARTSPTSRRS